MGCEDPRVTFVPVLDRYLMAYTAFGTDGPRIAVAHSQDGYRWERLGLASFAPDLPQGGRQRRRLLPRAGALAQRRSFAGDLSSADVAALDDGRARRGPDAARARTVRA